MTKNKYNDDKDKAKAKIEILGKEYIIKGDEPADYIVDLGNFVNKHLQKVEVNNPSVSKNRIMILGFMNLADNLCKTQEMYEKKEDEYNKIQEDYQNMVRKYNKLREDYVELENEYNEFLELVEEGGLD